MRDGDVVALEGFTHLIPFAAGHEIIRQRPPQPDADPHDARRDLRPADRRRAAPRSWSSRGAAIPGVGSLHRLRDAVENDWPAPLAIEEHAHAGMAAAYAAGASGLPFGLLRGYLGSDLPKYNDRIKFIDCPVHRRAARHRAGGASGRLGHPRAESRPPRQRADVGAGRRAEGGRAGRDALDRHRRGDRRSAGCAAERRGAAALGGQRRVRGAGRRVPVLRAGLLRAQQRVLQAVGRRRHASATASPPGSSGT